MDLKGCLGKGPLEGQVMPAAAVGPLMAAAGVATVEQLMLALLPQAQALARPVISGFRVGAVGRERETGALVLGANVEFTDATAADTIHAEQFLFSRAFHRGTSLDLIAVSARPCGHCRQFMAEFAGRDALVIFDASGDRLTLAEMLPWSFTPADLGETGATPGPAAARDVQAAALMSPELREALGAAGGRAYAPYSRAPSAVALRIGSGRLDGGRIVTGSAIENAAFNPGLPPLQAALINLVAAGEDYPAIADAVIGCTAGGAVDHAGASRRLLARLAPQARFDIVTWR